MGQDLKSIDACTLIKRDSKPPEGFLEPLFHAGQLNLLHAYTGIGKTYFALWVAAAIAGGGEFLKWKAAKPRKVLYVDGEMNSVAMETRLKQIATFAEFEVEEGFCNILSPDMCPDNQIFNFAFLPHQEIYKREAADRDFVVIDNYCSCIRQIGNETEVAAWTRVQKLLVDWRIQGKCILLVHHEGKGGSQLGTSVKEQCQDNIMRLRRSINKTDQPGLAFDIYFLKNRVLIGKDIEPLSILFQVFDDSLSWTWRSVAESQKDMLEACLKYKLTNTEMCETLKISILELKRMLYELREPLEVAPRADTGDPEVVYFEDGQDEMF